MAFGGLYISVSGLNASRYSLNTISHNISNANNPNYVRQSAIHGNSNYRGTNPNQQVGTGVQVKHIRQIRDEFLDLQIRGELPKLGYYQGKSESLGDVEAIFNEITSSGMQSVMNDFWNSWNELDKEPESSTLRALVHESAVAYTQTVNHISSQLNWAQQNIDKEITNKVNEVNRLLEDIQKLNSAIKKDEADVRMKANDLRDERNAAIDRLSSLLPVKTYTDPQGGTVVSLHGRDLVNGAFVNKVQIDVDPNLNNGYGYLYWEGTDEKIDLKGSGEIGGYIAVRDESINEYKDRLDIMVKSMADKINGIMEKGHGLDGTEGTHFFVAANRGTANIDAANIRVNPKLHDLNKMAVSSKPVDKGGVGNGELIKEIYNLRDNLKIEKYKTPGEKLNLDQYYRDIVTSLALEKQEADTQTTSQTFLITAIDQKRQAVSNVSMDEEMADMVKFQHSYAANSRVLNAVDEMIDVLVNRLGLVGR